MNIFTILFHCLLPSFRQLPTSIHSENFIILCKDLLKLHFKFCKEYDGWVKPSSQTVSISTLSPQMVWHNPHWILCFYLNQFLMSFIVCYFYNGLLVNKCFLLHNNIRIFPSTHAIYTTSASLDEDWPLIALLAVGFSCPLIAFHKHVGIKFV